MTDAFAVVSKAWASCLPGARSDGGLTFAEAGGDSLLALRLVHDLGLAVGHDLPLDVLGMDDTAAEVAAALAAILAGTADAGRDARHPGPAMPHLVLVTGAYGDEPALAGLRRRLGGVTVTTVEPPGIEAPDDVLGSMAAMAGTVLDAVPPTGPVHLAGFSFGGPLAVEAAIRLVAGGRTVASLGLLDAPFSREAMRLNLWAGRGPFEHAWWALQTLPGRWRPARMGVATVVRRTLGGTWTEHALDRRLLDAPRRRALSAWRPELPDVPTLVVVGDGLGEANAADWARAAPRARHLRVPGGHGDVLVGGNLDLVAEAVLSGLRA